MDIEPLPPLNTLIAFERVARYCSFSSAADDLNLTQSAVSRQILQLEDALGCKLFQRKQRRVMLTPNGELYAEKVRKLLHDLSLSTAEVMGWNGHPQITLACSSAIGSLWLLPRLSDLRREMPELQVHIKIADSFDELKPSEFDIAMFYLSHPPANMEVAPLFDEVCFPVCAPGFFADSAPLTQADALLNHTLLVQDGTHREWTGWRDWFHAQGVSKFMPRQAWRINHYPLLVQAAELGNGILLGWEGLLERQLNTGTLVPAHEGRLATSSKCFLLMPSERHTRPVVRKLARWLCDHV